jgi:hypothetical protein
MMAEDGCIHWTEDFVESKEHYEQHKREMLERRVEEHNANIIPDHEGYVRTDGPRRQYRASIRSGELYFEEI